MAAFLSIIIHFLDMSNNLTDYSWTATWFIVGLQSLVVLEVNTSQIGYQISH